MIYCIFRGGLVAVKCGGKSYYGRSSVPTRIKNATGHSWRTGVNSATKEIRQSRISAVATHNYFIYLSRLIRVCVGTFEGKTARRYGSVVGIGSVV
jgi:hypothetical protein